MVPSAAHNDKSQQLFLYVKVSTNIDIVIQQDDAPSLVSTKSVALTSARRTCRALAGKQPHEPDNDGETYHD